MNDLPCRRRLLQLIVPDDPVEGEDNGDLGKLPTLSSSYGRNNDV
jgi:hypothetical protein